MQGDRRVAGLDLPVRIGGRDPQSRRIPGDAQRGGDVRHARLLDRGGQGGKIGKGPADALQAGLPGPPLGIVVAPEDPGLHGGEETHDLLLARLHRPGHAVVRGAVEPGSPQEVPAPQDQPGSLGPAQALAARVGHRVGAHLQVDVRHVGALGGGVHQDGDAPGAAGLDHGWGGDLAEVRLVADDGDQGRALGEGRRQLAAGDHLHHPRPGQANGAVIVVAVGGLDDHLIGHPLSIGKAGHLLRVRPGHTGRGELGEGGGAAGGDIAPLGAGEFREAPADGGHQFVHHHVPIRRGGHGLGDGVERPGAGEHRVGAAAVDQRANAEGGVGGRRQGRASGRGGRHGRVPFWPTAKTGRMMARRRMSGRRDGGRTRFSAHNPRGRCLPATGSSLYSPRRKQSRLDSPLWAAYHPPG